MWILTGLATLLPGRVPEHTFTYTAGRSRGGGVAIGPVQRIHTPKREHPPRFSKFNVS